MTLRTTFQILLLTTVTTVQAATLIWTGNGDGVSLFDEQNWQVEDGQLPGNFIPKGPGQTRHNLIINKPGRIGGTNGWGGTLDLGGTGSLTVSGEADFFRMSVGGTATLKNGSVYFKGGSRDFDFSGTWDQVNAKVATGIDLAGPLKLTNKTILNTGWLAYNQVVLDGASILRVRGNNKVFAWGKINLIDTDSKIIFTGGKTIEAVIKDHLSGNPAETRSHAAGCILVNGNGAVPGFNITVYNDPDTGCTVAQAIGKPETFGLLLSMQ